jgi:hypothetical protein
MCRFLEGIDIVISPNKSVQRCLREHCLETVDKYLVGEFSKAFRLHAALIPKISIFSPEFFTSFDNCM